MKHTIISSEGKNNLINELLHTFHQCDGNQVIVTEKDNMKLEIFNEPLIGFASADDPLFEQYKQENVIGPCFLTPREWLPEAKTVISIFFPYTEQIRSGERADTTLPSFEWLYGRIEGQDFITGYTKKVCEWFLSQGIKACVPTMDERFQWGKDEFLDGKEKICSPVWLRQMPDQCSLRASNSTLRPQYFLSFSPVRQAMFQISVKLFVVSRNNQMNQFVYNY